MTKIRKSQFFFQIKTETCGWQFSITLAEIRTNMTNGLNGEALIDAEDMMNIKFWRHHCQKAEFKLNLQSRAFLVPNFQRYSGLKCVIP